MFLLIAYLLLALVVSFLCSIMESVLLSTPQSFLMVKKEENKKWASSFLEKKQNIDKPLSAILSLNTVAHTIGAAGVGAQAIIVFGDEAFGIVSAILTVLILIVTEIIPKTIGARYWRNLAKTTSHIINVMMIITYPLVIMSAKITKLLSGRKEEKSTSREEIAALASIGASEGLISDKENKIIQNIIKLKGINAHNMMTPRVVVVTADENMTLKEFMLNKDYLKFSRIPLYNEKEDHVTGYVIRQEIFEQIAENKYSKMLKDFKHNIFTAPASTSLYTLWGTLLERKEHIALIVDEYGGFDGIVTMEDIIETLLGLEIIDENDMVADMQKYARDRWKQRQVKYKFLEDIDQLK